jgi:hypothetical protein
MALTGAFDMRVVNVGDGACSVFTAPPGASCRDVMVLDCGGSSTSGMPEAATLARVLGPDIECLTTLVVSHFDRDHWAGLKALALYFAAYDSARGTFHEPRLIYPAMPRGIEDLGSTIMALITLDASNGMRALDLQQQWHALGYRLPPCALRKGDELDAGGRVWDVLWPPEHVAPGFLGEVKTALDEVKAIADTLARAGDIALKEALQQAHELWPSPDPGLDEAPDDPSMTFRDEVSLSADGEESTGHERNNQEDPDKATEWSFADIAAGDLKERLRIVAKKLQRSNNRLSLVMHTRDRDVLTLGDCEGSALKHVLPTLEATYPVMLAPHHGSHRTAGLPGSDLCVAQAGPHRDAGFAAHANAHHGAYCVTTHGTGRDVL